MVEAPPSLRDRFAGRSAEWEWHGRRAYRGLVESDARTDAAIQGTGDCDPAGSWETFERASIDHRAPRYRRIFLQRNRRCIGGFDWNRQITPRTGESRFEAIADALFVGPAREVAAMHALNCSSAQKLMSPFIDSMVSAKEALRLEDHVSI